jgi:putative integral membrane protein (TIGR02587 family)
MSQARPLGPTAGERDRLFLIGISRAFGGAIFFSLPLLMTMEMWSLGFSMDRLRLAMFMTLMIPLLITLDHYAGFEETVRWSEDVLDGFVGYGVGIVSSAVILLLLNVIDSSQPLSEIIGKICLQAVPAAFGAVLASSQLAHDSEEEKQDEERRRAAGYGAQIFFMMVGAVFLSFNVAPTEEVVLIAAMITPWRGVAIVLISLLMMHGFVYAVSFRGTPVTGEERTEVGLFLRFTMVGYATALLISAYVLWTFGRFEGLGMQAALLQSIVLAFPASLGAAAARLIL